MYAASTVSEASCVSGQSFPTPNEYPTPELPSAPGRLFQYVAMPPPPGRNQFPSRCGYQFAITKLCDTPPP